MRHDRKGVVYFTAWESDSHIGLVVHMEGDEYDRLVRPPRRRPTHARRVVDVEGAGRVRGT